MEAVGTASPSAPLACGWGSGLTVCEVVYYGIIFIQNTRNVIFVVKFCSHLNVCNVLSLLLKHHGVKTFLETLENTLSIFLLVLDGLCMSMGAGSLSRQYSKWSGHLSCVAMGEVLSLE